MQTIHKANSNKCVEIFFNKDYGYIAQFIQKFENYNSTEKDVIETKRFKSEQKAINWVCKKLETPIFKIWRKNNAN